MSDIRLKRIISGGQTGVDRAALDCAITHNYSHGGWCPAGRLAEDGVIHSRYGLTETSEADYRVRTRLNVKESDGTMILARQPLQGGTALTAAIARELRKPCLIIEPDKDASISNVLAWLEKYAIVTLNIAGPRASKQPEIYDHSYHFIDRVLNAVTSGIDTSQVR